MLLGVRCLIALNVQFHSDSFIQRCPSIPFWEITFSQSFHKLFSSLQSFSLDLLSDVKLLKVNLALFVSWIFLKSHQKPCHRQSLVKQGQLTLFAPHAFGALYSSTCLTGASLPHRCLPYYAQTVFRRLMKWFGKLFSQFPWQPTETILMLRRLESG